MSTVRINGIVELNDGYGSYICEYGHLHDYSKFNIEEVEKDRTGKTYNDVEELMKELEQN